MLGGTEAIISFDDWWYATVQFLSHIMFQIIVVFQTNVNLLLFIIVGFITLTIKHLKLQFNASIFVNYISKKILWLRNINSRCCCAYFLFFYLVVFIEFFIDNAIMIMIHWNLSGKFSLMSYWINIKCLWVISNNFAIKLFYIDRGQVAGYIM